MGRLSSQRFDAASAVATFARANVEIWIEIFAASVKRIQVPQALSAMKEGPGRSAHFLFQSHERVQDLQNAVVEALGRRPGGQLVRMVFIIPRTLPSHKGQQAQVCDTFHGNS